jgi:hypothetical protein
MTTQLLTTHSSLSLKLVMRGHMSLQSPQMAPRGKYAHARLANLLMARNSKADNTCPAVGRVGQTLAEVREQLDDQNQEMAIMQAQRAHSQLELATAKSTIAAREAETRTCNLLCLGRLR